jgi:predicted MPP superfamily phosphohydrolase
MFKLKATGRGGRFTVWRGVMETVVGVASVGDWPARALDLLPAATRVREVQHALAAGRGARSPLRLAFASDLHIGPLTPSRLLDEAFRALAAWRPDVLVLGGDYVFLDVTPASAARLTQLVASVPATTKVAVLGNHDLWTDHGLIERALAAGGARVLVNQSLTLPPPHDDVALVGFDDPWCGAPDPARAFADVTAPVRVVVAHAPEGLPLMAGHAAALMLCGHTHGGQVALPSGPLWVYGAVGRKYPAGLYDVDRMKLGVAKLYVGRGLGNVDLPVRFNAPPEVALFTIT